jgi:nickel superoxide dismutase
MRMKQTMRMSVLVSMVVVAVLGVAMRSGGHCQIPCGIYDDEVRLDMMEEHVDTIEKSIDEINALSEDPEENANQIARWVANKDAHADMLAEIVTEYFLQQRIKPMDDDDDDEAYDEYIEQVVACHQILVAAMKTKQSADPDAAEYLEDLVEDFRDLYLGEDEDEDDELDDHGEHDDHGDEHRMDEDHRGDDVE